MKHIRRATLLSFLNARMVCIGLGLIFVFATVQCRATFPHKGDVPVPAVGVRSSWPHEASDLNPDPDVHFGRLPNGVRYLLMENQTPKDRVSMHLYIQAGSLLETTQEQGAAHFLEHMLFNGTKNFPPGEMIKYFQRIGMQFGPDANAHTGFDRTVYDVLLPKGDSTSLSEGLLVLRDYADGALLLADEVEKERRVILAEMRSRDSAEFRTLKAGFKFEMPDYRVSHRFPIGKKEILKQMDHQVLRDFYEAWYRPERLFLIIVGDFKADDARSMIAKHFAGLKALSPERDLPDFGNFAHKGIKTFFHHEDDAGATTIAIETMAVEAQSGDSRERRMNRLLRSLALQMMQKRLDQLLKHPESVMTTAAVAGGTYLQHLKYSEIQATTKSEHWKAAMAVIEQSLRSALQYGFGDAELQRAKSHMRSQLSRRIQQSDTRDSKFLARKIMAKISNWQVIQSPQQIGDLLSPMLESITLEAVNQAFANLWEADHRLILVTGDADLADSSVAPDDQLQTAFTESQQASVQPYLDQQIAKFPYIEPPSSSGGIAKKNHIKDLGIHDVAFENGVRLYMKPTKFKANQVLVALSFGGGRASEPEDQPGLAKLTEAVVEESGFGKMDRVALEDALTGRLASTKLHIREDMFTIKGEAVKSELPLLFQLLNTHVVDPGFRDDARKLALKRFEQSYENLAHSTDGMMELLGHRFLAGGDSRFGMPAWQEVRQRTLEQIKQWYGRQLKTMPLELSVVGDFEPQTVVALAAQYLGTLPPRQSETILEHRSGPVFPNGESLQLTADTEIQKALLVVAYPTDDFWQITRTRRLAVMADLFSERLRQRVRENLGAAYSPFAYNRSHRSYSGYGLSKIFIQLDPNQASNILNEVHFIADQMAANPPDPDEFRRVLDPTLTQIKDFKQTNPYWLNNVLAGASRHPVQFEWSRSFADDYASITAADITAMARRYLDNGKAATVIIKPADKQ